jgi:hypothetical protein
VTRRIIDVMANENGAPRELTGRLPLDQVLELCPVALLEVR